MGWRLPTLLRVAAVATAAASSVAGTASALSGAARAQSPPSFGAEAELVTVDAVVLGPDGKPVAGLTRDDFVVKEDGRPQAITTFDAVEAIVPALESPDLLPSSPARARVATNVAGVATRRTFAIVFDDLHIGESNIEEAKRAVAAFAERVVRPGDRLVLFTVFDARYWATTRGAQDGGWMEALRAVRSHRLLRGRPGCEPTYYEAMQIDLLGNKQVEDLVQRRFAALCAPPTMRASPEQLAQQAIASEMQRSGVSQASGSGQAPPGAQPSSGDSAALGPSAAEAYSRYRNQLAATLRIVRHALTKLVDTRGRKDLVLLSEGFPTDSSLDVFRDVRQEAARANVAIHFLDARGLATGPDFLSADGATGLLAPPDVGPTVALWKLEDSGAKTLAQETGGRVLQTNDLVTGLAEVADESRVTYLLGYEPANRKRDGRFRRLAVEVRRPGLQVRARSGYFAAKGDAKPATVPTPVQRALRGLFDADAIPLRLAAYVMGPAPVSLPTSEEGGLEVLFAGEVRLDALETQSKDGRRLATSSFELLTGSLAGESHHADWSLEVTLGPSQPDAGDSLWHPFLTRIAMGPGSHRARLVVQSGNRVGSVTVDFEVPRPTLARLSTPVLSDRLVANASERRVLPLARRAFSNGGALHCWVELVGAGIDPATGQPRARAEFAVRTQDGSEWARGPAVAMDFERGRPTRLVSLPLSNAPAGEHELVLRVHDEVSGASFETREPFRIEGIEAGGSYSLSMPTDGQQTAVQAAAAAPPRGERQDAAVPAGVASPAAQAPQPPSAAGPAPVDLPAAPKTTAPPAPAGTPTFTADSEVVLLDVVARDRRGRPVTDLRADELQVFENGQRCEVRSFRRVHAAKEALRSAAEARPAAPGSPVPAIGPQAQGATPSRANLVVLLFQALYDEKAMRVREAALELLERSFPPGTWFAAYKTSWRGTQLLQPFTNSSGGRLRQAVLDATASSVDRRTGSEANRREDAAGDRGAPAPAPGNPAAAGLLSLALDAKDLAESTEAAEGAHFRGREDLATFSGIQEIVRNLSNVRGRKAIVYFAVDHELGGGEISGGRASLAYAEAMSDANRANVTVHTVDARGLECSRVGGRSAFDKACGVGAAGAATAGGPTTSVSWTAATETERDDQGPLLGDPERIGSMFHPTRSDSFLTIHSGSLLEHVAEATGGLAIRNTNDLAAGLERVTDELREYYEVVYAPPNPAHDGRFRAIQVRTTRPGVAVRTRAGYFATP